MTSRTRSTSLLLPEPLARPAEPRLHTGPKWNETEGDDAISFGLSIGHVLDPWQRFYVRNVFGLKPGGRPLEWAAFETAQLVARQNGKGGELELIELFGLFVLHEPLILHSAHEFKTASEAFLRVKAHIDSNDFLSKRVKSIRTSHGEEGIILKGGPSIDGRPGYPECRLRFVARSKSSGRGFTGKRIIWDEVQETASTAVGAMLPTLGAVYSPQINYAGTVPNVLNESDHFASLRDRGRRGDSDLYWEEHNLTSDPILINELIALVSAARRGEELEPGEEQLILEAQIAANPAERRPLPQIRKELKSMHPADYAREILTLWPDGQAGSVIPTDRWSDNKDEDSDFNGEPVWGIDTDPGRTMSTISIAGIRSDGHVHGEVVESKTGTAWVVPRIIELVNNHGGTVVINPGSAAGAYISDLQNEGIEPLLLAARDYVQACGQVYDLVVRDRLHHLGQQELDLAVAAATRLDRGDAWVWNRRSVTADITPLISLTLAIWGLHLAKPAIDPLKTMW